MSKKYVEPGMKIQLHLATVRVGLTGTLIDLQPNWEGTADRRTNQHVDDKDAWDEIGSLCDHDGVIGRRNLTHPVYVEELSGRLWFDDMEGL